MTALYSAAPSEGLLPGHKKPSLFVTRLLMPSFAVICAALVCYSAYDGISNLYDRWMYEDDSEFIKTIKAATEAPK